MMIRFCWDILGDGELKNQIQELIKRYQLEDAVIFTGVRRDIPQILSAMDVFVFPSFHEGIPGTSIGAYAAGVPVISAKWESFVDVVDDGETGYCYEFGNTETLRQMLPEIAENPAEITDLKENCLQKAQNYTLENAIQILSQKIEKQ